MLKNDYAVLSVVPVNVMVAGLKIFNLIHYDAYMVRYNVILNLCSIIGPII